MNLQKKVRNNSGTGNIRNRITIALLIIYLVALTWILLFKLGVQFSYMQHRSVNLVPFSTPVILNGKADAGEIILNVVVFIPLGIYAGVLFDGWNFGRKLFFFFLVSLIIETFQFAFAVGAFDSTDIITNTFGGIVGLLIYIAIEKALNNRGKAQKFINVIASIATVLMIVLLLLLKLNMLPVRYQ